MFFELNEDETINRIPFYRQPFIRKEKNYDENYKKQIEYNKTKFLNFFSNDWVEVKKEDAKFVLVVYPNIFEIKKIYNPEEESNDKKYVYLKYVKNYMHHHQKRFF